MNRVRSETASHTALLVEPTSETVQSPLAPSAASTWGTRVATGVATKASSAPETASSTLAARSSSAPRSLCDPKRLRILVEADDALDARILGG